MSFIDGGLPDVAGIALRPIAPGEEVEIDGQAYTAGDFLPAGSRLMIDHRSGRLVPFRGAASELSDAAHVTTYTPDGWGVLRERLAHGMIRVMLTDPAQRIVLHTFIEDW